MITPPFLTFGGWGFMPDGIPHPGPLLMSNLGDAIQETVQYLTVSQCYSNHCYIGDSAVFHCISLLQSSLLCRRQHMYVTVAVLTVIQKTTLHFILQKKYSYILLI